MRICCTNLFYEKRKLTKQEQQAVALSVAEWRARANRNTKELKKCQKLKA